MKSTLSIRRAGPQDAAEIARLGRQFYDAAGLESLLGEYSEEAITALLSNEAVAVFVAETDRIAGFAAGIVYPHFLKPSVSVGQELFWWVEPEFRASGVGLQLMQALEGWAMASGASSFSMLTIHGLDHERAGQIYERAGYSILEHTYIKRF